MSIQLLVKEYHRTAAALRALSKRDTMFNATMLGIHTLPERRFWIFVVLSNFDAWCGNTRHTVLRYILRCLLILVLIGTFAIVLVRTLDPEWRAQLKTRYKLAGEAALLGQSKPRLVAGTLGEANMVVKARNGRIEMNGPDVKDSCTVMQKIIDF